MPGTIRVGISGWRYAPWRGAFYPKGLRQDDELKYAASKFKTLELNGSFYSLQRPEFYQHWYDEVPDDFIFAVKGSRFITHLRRLKEIKTPLANFFASGVLALGKKLGPFLWQFPPQLPFIPERFAEFFALLPQSVDEAVRLARRHDKVVAGRSWFRARDDRPLHHAVEIRHGSFVCQEFVKLMKRHNLSFVVADAANKYPLVEEVTGDFLYLRLHGAEELYVSGYTDEALKSWADRVTAWASGSEPVDARKVTAGKLKIRKARDVYVYFDNDAKVKAPFDALKLESLVNNVQSDIFRQRRSAG